MKARENLLLLSEEGIENELPPSIADIMYIDAHKKSLDEVASEIKRAVST